MVVHMLADVEANWRRATPEDRQGFAQNLFSEIVLDLDTRQIAGFKLKPWAEPFLQVRVEFNLRTVLAPEGFGNKTVHTLDMAQMEREVLDWMYPDRHERRPTRYNHLPAQERNAEIVRRRRNGDSLTSLAREFGITVQRVWYIVRRGR